MRRHLLLHPRIPRQGRRATMAACCLAGGLFWAGVADALPAGTGGAAGVATAAAAGPATSGNLLTGDQASFTDSTGGWVGKQAVVSWNGAAGDDAPGALELTATTGQGMSAWSSATPAPSVPGATPAQPGLVYTGTASAEAVGPSEAVSAGITFYTSSGNVLHAVFGQESTVTASAWSVLTDAVGLAPAGTAYVTFGVLVFSTSAGQQLLVDDASLESTTDTVAPVDGPLSVSGDRILQADGSPVTLRGINLWGFEDSGDPANITENTVAQMKAWGANMVRVPLGEQLWLSSSCAYDPTYEATIEQVVTWITSLGMVALLDLHFDNPADIDAPAGTCPAAGLQDMADDPGSVEFWSQVAGEFADNPLVAFDLYNEPHTVTDTVWLDGGSVGSGTGAYQAAGMQQLYDAVRGAGADNLVAVSGNGWGNDPPSRLVAGDNIVYSAHAYTCPVDPPPDCMSASPSDPSTLLDPWVAFSSTHPVPVIVGEFGWPDPSSGTYNANVIAFAEAQGWGWAVYEWDGSDGGGFDLLQANAATGAAEPAPSGMPVLAALARASTGPATTPPTCGCTSGGGSGGSGGGGSGGSGGSGGGGSGGSGGSGGGGSGGSGGSGGGTSGDGYLMVGSDGGIFSFGGARFSGSMGGKPLDEPIVGMAADPATGGYWEVASDGGIFSFDAPFHGSMGGTPLDEPIVGMAADPATGGYWEVASDGGIFSFDAPFHGSMGGTPLDEPIVGMASTPDGGGYWLVAADGGIFSFGDARFYGSTGSLTLDRPIVGMAADPATGGYWEVASDGGIFSFDAPFHGSMGGTPLDEPIVGMAADPATGGYWEVASDGGIFSFDAPFHGSMGGTPLDEPIVGMATT